MCQVDMYPEHVRPSAYAAQVGIRHAYGQTQEQVGAEVCVGAECTCRAQGKVTEYEQWRTSTTPTLCRRMSVEATIVHT